jgi:hydrogenase nickel incorporation protein HypB
MFRESRCAVMTKIDLLPHLSFDLARAIGAMREVNPELELFMTSATTGEGMDAWLAFLRREVARAWTGQGALRG